MCPVVRETLVKNGTANPSAALIQALLINGAVSLPGEYTPSEAGASPNNASGWGRVNLAGSIILPGPNSANGALATAIPPVKQGQDGTVIIKVPLTKAPPQDVVPFGTGLTLKVTIVWTDPPGAKLQNDLDLIVTAANGQVRTQPRAHRKIRPCEQRRASGLAQHSIR